MSKRGWWKLTFPLLGWGCMSVVFVRKIRETQRILSVVSPSSRRVGLCFGIHSSVWQYGLVVKYASWDRFTLALWQLFVRHSLVRDFMMFSREENRRTTRSAAWWLFRHARCLVVDCLSGFRVPRANWFLQPLVHVCVLTDYSKNGLLPPEWDCRGD